jgi:two-component system sensor histidine kinase HydH
MAHCGSGHRARPGHDVKLPIPPSLLPGNHLMRVNGNNRLEIGERTADQERIVTKRNSRKLKGGLICGAILGITLFHYIIGVNPLNHQIYGKFYYAPVIVAALWFGVRGGVITSIIIDLLLIPHFLINWGSHIGGLWGILLEIPTLNLTGLVAGYLSDKELQRRTELKQISHLASLKGTYSFAAHEMKNIGISIHGFAKLIKRKTDPSEDVARFLGIIERESQRIERLAKGMLRISKNSELKSEKFDPKKFLGDVMTITQEMADGKGVEFQSEIEESLSPVWLDSEKMKEVLVNLTQNAIQATPSGGRVTLKASGNGENVKIQIIDTGSGIPPSDLDKIFFPFFTTKPEGNGIGLTVSKEVVEAHGGKIEVNSKEGAGTQFTIILPVTN